MNFKVGDKIAFAFKNTDKIQGGVIKAISTVPESIWPILLDMPGEETYISEDEILRHWSPLDEALS